MKEIAYIETPRIWIGFDDYSSHRELLWLALTKTDKAVVEFGCGKGSTQLLHDYCKEHKRLFLSYETNPSFSGKFKFVVTIKDYFSAPIPLDTSIIFIDCAPGEIRRDLIEKHANHSKVLIIHDTEEYARRVYQIEDILNSFKYRLDYCPDMLPSTSVVSNRINVETWI